MRPTDKQECAALPLDIREGIDHSRGSRAHPSVDGERAREETMLMLMTMKPIDLAYRVIVSALAA
jgi:hypothetical protein